MQIKYKDIARLQLGVLVTVWQSRRREALWLWSCAVHKGLFPNDKAFCMYVDSRGWDVVGERHDTILMHWREIGELPDTPEAIDIPNDVWYDVCNGEMHDPTYEGALAQARAMRKEILEATYAAKIC